MTPSAATLVALLEEQAARFGDKPWLLFPKAPTSSAEAETFSFAQALAAAAIVAARLQELDAPARSRALVIHDNDADFVASFVGTLMAGLIPVPVAPPYFLANLDDYRQRLEHLQRECEPRVVFTTEALGQKLVELGTRTPVLVPSPAETSRPAPAIAGPAIAPDDVAFIQFTSGSTAAPKGIALSHENLLHNVRGIGGSAGVREGEVVVSWLPFFHDMGLIGGLLFTLYFGLPLVVLAPRTFLAKPHSWLWAVSRFRGTLSIAPNFAFQLCATRLKDAALAGLDLSSWRLAVNGAEQVRLETIEAFTERFAPYGFPRNGMFPVYGLAENTLAATFPAPGAPVRVDYVDREVLSMKGRAAPAAKPQARAVVSVGRPIEGVAVRVVDADGRVVGEREVGEIELGGPCVMRGIFGKPEEHARRVRGGWLATGDRGYQADGELFIVGRSTDIIKRMGRRYDAEDIEAALARVEGIRSGGLAAIGIENAASGSDDLVIVAELRRASPKDGEGVRAAIRRQLHAAIGIQPDAVHLVEPGSLPKTTSGKIRRAECRRRLAAGLLDELVPAAPPTA